ncbi:MULTISPECIES: alpha/beta fold hydrolase [Sphingobium]|uniref:alpha/beta fold hydrolase n=1 Tax=Sphingobium sp. MI1205 TaxID=407020 RepID=UPI0007704091|nr:alpha/beta hydrolase [Sphingobium sp. MI1205]AMK18821.1 lysophospholipase [Sphingobium sp. MI1205]
MRPMDSPASVPPAFDRRAWPMNGRLDHWTAPDGWSLRRYRLGDGQRGQLLMLGGRGDMIEKYLEVIAHWAARGWAVTAFDWRGQGGSGRLTDDPMCGHIDDFGQWVADLKAFVADWRAQSTGPHAIVAHSMGGHLLLRALAEGMPPPDVAITVAPMMGVHTAPLPRWLAVAITHAMCALGFESRRAWTQKEDSGRQRAMRQKRLTHDPERYADELWWRDHSRDVALGPPSWRWVAQALQSTRALEQDEALKHIRVPLLILATNVDRLVSTPAIRRMAARIPAARLHVYGAEAAHEILRELDPVRLDALRRIDAFLDEVAPV